MRQSYRTAVTWRSNPVSAWVWRRITGRVPELAILAFGAALGLVLSSGKDLKDALGATGRLGPFPHVATYLGTIVFVFLMWAYFVRVAELVLRYARLRGDVCLLVLASPLIFIVAFCGAFELYPGTIAWPSSLLSFKAAMLGAFFGSLAAIGAALLVFEHMDAPARVEVRACVVSSAYFGSACLIGLLSSMLGHFMALDPRVSSATAMVAIALVGAIGFYWMLRGNRSASAIRRRFEVALNQP